MSEYEELREAARKLLKQEQREWPYYGSHIKADNHKTWNTALDVALRVLWLLILEALKAKDEELHDVRLERDAAWAANDYLRQGQAEHRLAEALKHLEDVDLILYAFTDGFRSDIRGRRFSNIGWWQEQVEPWRERYSNFLKSQKDKQDVEGSPKNVLSRECEFDHHSLCTYEWTNPPIGVYTGRCRCTCPCHSKQPSTPQPTKGGGHSAD